MSDLIDDGSEELGPTLSSSDRLRALLFLVDKKLEQKRRVQFDIYIVLAVLIAISLLLLTRAGAALAYGRLLGDDTKEAARSVLMVRGWFWTLGLLLAPFVISFLHYLWITFAQISYRFLNVVDHLLETSDFEEFRPVLHKELLEDDGSLLCLLRNVLSVDVGLASTLFSVGGMACTLLPVVAQAIGSLVTTVLLWRDNIPVAIGLAVFYFLALMLAVRKTWSLYRFVQRME